MQDLIISSSEQFSIANFNSSLLVTLKVVPSPNVVVIGYEILIALFLDNVSKKSSVLYFL